MKDTVWKVDTREGCNMYAADVEGQLSLANGRRVNAESLNSCQC